MSKLKIKLMRLNDYLCRLFFGQCGYCSSEVNRLPSGATVCAGCRRRRS